jgi:hypothetical protein
MLTGLTRSGIALVIGLSWIAGSASAAAAGDGWLRVDCDGGRSECSASAGTTEIIDTGGDNDRSRSGRSGERTCASGPFEIPCSLPGIGSARDDGCYYQASNEPPPAGAVRGSGPGGWYFRTCLGGNEVGSGVVWLPGGGGPVAAPPPVVVARRAVDRLTLPDPVIAASPAPGLEQLVSVPTWLWLQRGAWRGRNATAAVPGVSVTATATPTKVTWSMGDGSRVVCRGPGTPYRVSADPGVGSPDCGHTYRRSSAGQPGGTFRVTAVISWSISWAGGGETGTLPDLETTSTAAFRVSESQALVNDGVA